MKRFEKILCIVVLPKYYLFLLQITEEDERTSSRNSMDKDFMERIKNQISKEETSSIVESEDGVAKIHIGSGDVFKQFIEVKNDDEDENQENVDAITKIETKIDDDEQHRKISGTMTPTVVEVIGRN